MGNDKKYREADVLHKNDVIRLSDPEGVQIEYTILEALGRKRGSTSVAYKAVRDDGQTVVLKEFFPDEKACKACRDQGSNVIAFSGDKGTVDDFYHSFRRSAEKLQEYAEDSALREYIAVNEETKLGLLRDPAGQAYYYENAYHASAISLDEAARSAEFSIFNILQAMTGTFRFLKALHKKGDVLVDLKPEDILITSDNPYHNNLNFRRLGFFDFGSVGEVGERVSSDDVEFTKAYGGGVYDVVEEDGNIGLSVEKENQVFANVCSKLYRWKAKNRRMPAGIPDGFNELLALLREATDNDESGEIEKTLTTLTETCRTEDEKNGEMNRQKMEKTFRPMRRILLITSVLLYSVLAIGMVWLCMRFKQTGGSGLSGLGDGMIAAILLFLILCITGMKLMVSRTSSRIARPAVCSDYYTRIMDRNGDAVYYKDLDHFNLTYKKTMTLWKKFLFWINGRRKSTYIDDSLNNLERQHLRWVLWVVLFLQLAFCLGISIRLNSLPLLFVFGLPCIILFMYADVFWPTLSFYRHCIDEPTKKHRINRAKHYLAEYLESSENGNEPFNIAGPYYKEHYRNMFTIRQQLTDLVKTKAKTGKYVDRQKAYEEFLRDGSRVDLDFPKLHMLHIYKMAFDRRRNNLLFCNIPVFLLTILALFLAVFSSAKWFRSYAEIPDDLYPWITGSLGILVCVFSVMQILNAGEEELLVAELSYKSRFMEPEALRDFLVFDIVTGVVQPVDVIRGINQAEGAVYTAIKEKYLSELQSLEDRSGKGKSHSDRVKRQRIEQNLKELTDPKNRRMLHHDRIGNQERLLTTIWLGFGTLFALYVWYLRCLWLLPVLAGGCFLLYMALRGRFLDYISKRNLMDEVEKLAQEARSKDAWNKDAWNKEASASGDSDVENSGKIKEKKGKRRKNRRWLRILVTILLIIVSVITLIETVGYLMQKKEFRDHAEKKVEIQVDAKLDLIGVLDSFGVPYSASVSKSFMDELETALTEKDSLGSSFNGYSLYINKTWQLDGILRPQNSVTMGEFAELQNFSIDFTRHKFPDRIKQGLTYTCEAGQEDMTVYEYLRGRKHACVLYSCSANDLFYYYASSLEGLNLRKIMEILSYLPDATEQLEAHIRKNLENLLKCNPQAVILVMGLYVPSDNFFLNRLGAKVLRKINRRIEAACEGFDNVHYVDVSCVAFGVLDNDFHPNAEGQHVLAVKLAEAMNRYCTGDVWEAADGEGAPAAATNDGTSGAADGEELSEIGTQEVSDAEAAAMAEELLRSVQDRALPTEDYVMCAVAFEKALYDTGREKITYYEIEALREHFLEGISEEKREIWERALRIEIAEKKILHGITETDHARDPNGIVNDKLSLLSVYESGE